MNRLRRNRILIGDARELVDQLPPSSIDTVITSPPYFRLRNYQHDAQLGLEDHVGAWVDELRLVAHGLARVLKPTGSLWLNLGDTFSRQQSQGASPKSLLLAPERLALALVEDGWILRNKVIWAKPNPMPTSVKDRLSCTWEQLYFFTRSPHSYFDLDAIRIPHASARTARARTATGTKARGRSWSATSSSAAPPSWSVPASWRGPSAGTNSGLERLRASGTAGHPLGKNPGDVWTIPTAGFRGAHHAVFPEALVERPLRATCPLRVCARCGRPWRRRAHRNRCGLALIGDVAPDCQCPAGAGSRPGVVLDPFMGAGTTALVAERLGRDWIGIEVHPGYARMAAERLAAARKGRAGGGEARRADGRAA